MTLDKYISHNYPVKCKGRNEDGDEVLDKSVNVQVNIHKHSGSNEISSIVQCVYNTGGHGDRCKASHPNVDKLGEGVRCPYCFAIPYPPEEESSIPFYFSVTG